MSPRTPGPFAAVARPALALLAVAVALQVARAPAERRPPDLVLISIDTLRADHLSAYGYPRPTSPNIDAFARGALVFDNCFSHGSDTRIAFASLMSGFLPHETAVMKTGAPSAEEALLPVVLRHRGYRTAAVVSNYVLRGDRGWDAGFDVFDDIMEEREAVRPLPERTAPGTTDRAIELLREQRAAPLFLWVHYQDPHGPYTPPQEHDLFGDPGAPRRPVALNARSLSGSGGVPAYQILDGEDDFHDYVSRYDGEIHYADRHVGRLLDELRRLGHFRSSLIVLTADHGEGMGEHDYYFAHGEQAWAPLLRVPLMLRLGSDLRGRRRDPVQHVDLFPTISALLGIAPDPRLRGRDLLTPPREGVERFAIVSSPVARERLKLSLARGGFQLVHFPEHGRSQLFDLSRDPLGLEDLSGRAEHRSRLEALERRALQIRAEDRTLLQGVGGRPPLSEEELERLRALGYVQ